DAGIPVQTGCVGTGTLRALSAGKAGGPNGPVCPASRVSIRRHGVIAMNGSGADTDSRAAGDFLPRARSSRTPPEKALAGCQNGGADQLGIGTSCAKATDVPNVRIAKTEQVKRLFMECPPRIGKTPLGKMPAGVQ